MLGNLYRPQSCAARSRMDQGQYYERSEITISCNDTFWGPWIRAPWANFQVAYGDTMNGNFPRVRSRMRASRMKRVR